MYILTTLEFRKHNIDLESVVLCLHNSGVFSVILRQCFSEIEILKGWCTVDTQANSSPVHSYPTSGPQIEAAPVRICEKNYSVVT